MLNKQKALSEKERSGKALVCIEKALEPALIVYINALNKIYLAIQEIKGYLKNTNTFLTNNTTDEMMIKMDMMAC